LAAVAHSAKVAAGLQFRAGPLVLKAVTIQH